MPVMPVEVVELVLEVVVPVVVVVVGELDVVVVLVVVVLPPAPPEPSSSPRKDPRSPSHERVSACKSPCQSSPTPFAGPPSLDSARSVFFSRSEVEAEVARGRGAEGLAEDVEDRGVRRRLAHVTAGLGLHMAPADEPGQAK